MQLKGSLDKLLEIEQWGNINWTSMNAAFANCQRVQLSAVDVPNLSNVTDASLMFYLATSFSGAPSMQNWNVSNIENFSHAFDSRHQSQVYASGETFNSPIGTWNVSSVTDMSFMFSGRQFFNQNLNSWNVSNVTNMAWMFAICPVYNQPLNNWNTVSLENMEFMFFNAALFNQPLNSWNTSHVIKMNQAFSYATSFNQPLDLWDVSNVTTVKAMFDHTSSFNQSLGSWDFNSLTNASGALNMTEIDCQNYSATLAGWADNPNTPNNINLGLTAPAQYATNVVDKRNVLINGKGWIILGDSQGSCYLSIFENQSEKSRITIYPNPTAGIVHLENTSDGSFYSVIDWTGKVAKSDVIKGKMIDIGDLPKGVYLLRVFEKKGAQIFKIIKE